MVTVCVVLQVVQPEIVIGAGTTLIATILVYVMVSTSGGHMNPLVTFSAMMTGLMLPARGFM